VEPLATATDRPGSLTSKFSDEIDDDRLELRLHSILASARARDVNESDTVVLVTDILQDVFGYDKYAEITSEHMIRGTFCDLAVKLDGHLSLLIEVKAIGLDLKEQFVKQAVDYAANQGGVQDFLRTPVRRCKSHPLDELQRRAREG
jgi:hypothetical protein